MCACARARVRMRVCVVYDIYTRIQEVKKVHTWPNFRRWSDIHMCRYGTRLENCPSSRGGHFRWVAVLRVSPFYIFLSVSLPPCKVVSAEIESGEI